VRHRFGGFGPAAARVPSGPACPRRIGSKDAGSFCSSPRSLLAIYSAIFVQSTLRNSAKLHRAKYYRSRFGPYSLPI
jgi:hypothetical protein